MKEELDIVDAHDNLVGKADRNSVHKKNLLHRGVQIFIFNSKGEIFVQQRGLKKDRFPGFWEASLSGHVSAGEAYKEAAERELHEELGVCIPPKLFKEFIKFGEHNDEDRMLVTLFVIKDFTGEVMRDEDEVKQGDFWSIKKLEEEIKKGEKFFHPSFLHAWKLYNEK
ncbi:MAG TPA: NUDIX domain-containing protein [Candidatus Nanoarchaeia archaeon]|nr:NUDIX domain-containing protein [Candidatus Nanoarchaeia archaeon]